MLDIKIINGIIYDGSGGESYHADIGITGDRISHMGDLSALAARKVIDAAGHAVAPGFIDMHTHSDLSVVTDPLSTAPLYNGVTTVGVGNCGIGVAPISQKNRELAYAYIKSALLGFSAENIQMPWETYDEYLQYLDSMPKGLNVFPLVAQGTIRIHEMGFDVSEPTEEQMERMKDEVRKAMDAGACGLTSGLIYLPGLYTKKEELAELCKVLKPYNAKYITHHRSESRDLYKALDEDFYICETAGVGLHISHLKVAYPAYWNDTKRLFDKIQEAIDRGIDVTYDAYPYIFAHTSLTAVLPGWCSEGGGVKHMLELVRDEAQRGRIESGIDAYFLSKGFGGVEEAAKNFYIAEADGESCQWMENKSIFEIAQSLEMHPSAAVCEIILATNAKAKMRLLSACQEDNDEIISRPETIVISDSASTSNRYDADSSTHPRTFGTQSIILRRFVREKKLLSLESAVRKMSAMPAELMRLGKRGLLACGYYADIIVFDADTVRDNATYEEPRKFTSGMEYVIVNGRIEVENGIQNENVLAGRLIKRHDA